jgi:hypothetical protein
LAIFGALQIHRFFPQFFPEKNASPQKIAPALASEVVGFGRSRSAIRIISAWRRMRRV